MSFLSVLKTQVFLPRPQEDLFNIMVPASTYRASDNINGKSLKPKMKQISVRSLKPQRFDLTKQQFFQYNKSYSR